MPSIQLEPYQPQVTNDWLVCFTCGTQFPTRDHTQLKTCHICDDPRQYVPPSGQSFTTLTLVKHQGYRNEFRAYATDPRLTFIQTVPQFAIGERAILIETPEGNILWDCITLLDEDTIDFIQSKGGLKAIAISHPHYYSTHIEWAKAFGCPVYIASDDVEWTTHRSSHQVLVKDTVMPVEDTKAQIIKLGGHFPGSLVLLTADRRLFIGDTFMLTPSGLGKWTVDAMGASRLKPAGHNTFAFDWSYPNRIPLGPDELLRMWNIIKDYSFVAAHGAFENQDLEADDMRERVLESMKIQTRSMGHPSHPILATEAT